MGQLNLNASHLTHQLKIAEKQLENKNSVEVEYNMLKRKHNQLKNQMNSYTTKFLKEQISNKGLKEKITNLQEKTKQLINQKTVNLKQIKQLKNKFKIIKNSYQDKKQKQDLFTELKNRNTKLNELKQKFSQNKSQRVVSLKQLQSKNQFLTRTIQQLESQIQHFKGRLSKGNAHSDKLQQKCGQLNAQIFALNSQLVHQVQKSKQLEGKTYEKQNILGKLQNDISLLQRKIKDFKRNIHDKQQQIFEYQKQIEDKQQQIAVTKDKLMDLEDKLKSKLTNLSQQNRQKQTLLQKKTIQLNQAAQQIKDLKNNLNSSQRQIYVIKNQIQHSNSKLKEYEQENLKFNEIINKLSEQKHQIQEKIANLQNQTKIATENNEKTQKALKKLQNQLQFYKQSLFESFSHLLQQFSKQQEVKNFKKNSKSTLNDSHSSSFNSTTLKGILDPRMSKIQIQLIQKRNNIILKHKAKVFQLEQVLKVSKIQKQRLKAAISQKQIQKQELIDKQKQKLKQIQQQLLIQRDQLNKRIQQLQQSEFINKNQIQKYVLQIAQYEQLFVEQKNGQQMLINQIMKLKQRQKNNESQLTQSQQQKNKQKQMSQKKFNQMTQYYVEIVEKLRQEIKSLQQEKKQVQNKYIDKEDQFKQIEIQSNQKNCKWKI